MFTVGDHVLYGKNGVCELTDICRSPLDPGDERMYYVFKPIHNSSATIYTPVDNEKVASRKIMGKEEADEFIKRIPSIEALMVENEKSRREVYKNAVAELSPEGFIQILKTVYSRRRSFETMKRHITEVDAEYENLAKKSLYSELSVILDIPYDQIEGYITEKIESQNKITEA